MSSSYASVTLGPVRLHGVTVSLRPPTFGDFAEWRRIRLRDRDCLEPYWFRSPSTWEQRHTAIRWVRECLTARAEARTGRRVSTVLEVDGRFAGQFELVGIDSGAAELSVWVDAEVARRGASGLAGSLLLDFGFDTVGLDRITAPIAVTNAGARRAVGQRWTKEAVMVGYFDVGSGRVDHELWSVTSDRAPVGGFAADWLDGYRTAHPSARSARTAGGAGAEARLPGTGEHGAGTPPRGSADSVVTDATVPLSTILRARARYCLGRIRHVVDPLRATNPGTARQGQVALRPWRRNDFRPRRAARIAARSLLAPTSAPEKWARRHTRREWWRAKAAARAGLRGRHGAVLVVEVAGHYVGECRLFDRDMFDRNIRAAVWVAPETRPEIAITALRLLITHATETLGIWRLTLAVPSADVAGAAVALAAGLRHEGTMHRYRGVDGELADHELWALSTAHTTAQCLSGAGGEPA
ncbi:GNAT family N-acetyltransferase [Nocardia sp. NPDC058633]|uniref:GNAT family N-acetyltransferase n=1 Tax=Nocardia sp. NPDC058633 TaxID=3346568 RepID=UPI003653C074